MSQTFEIPKIVKTIILIVAFSPVIFFIIFPLFPLSRDSRRKSDNMSYVCMSNQRQISLHINMYIQENDEVFPGKDVWEVIGITYEKVLSCPATKLGGNNYGYNAKLQNIAAGSVKFPDRTIMIADVNIWAKNNILSSKNAFDFRHKNGKEVIVSYAEGHVERISKTRMQRTWDYGPGNTVISLIPEDTVFNMPESSENGIDLNINNSIINVKTAAGFKSNAEADFTYGIVESGNRQYKAVTILTAPNPITFTAKISPEKAITDFWNIRMGFSQYTSDMETKPHGFIITVYDTDNKKITEIKIVLDRRLEFADRQNIWFNNTKLFADSTKEEQKAAYDRLLPVLAGNTDLDIHFNSKGSYLYFWNFWANIKIEAEAKHLGGNWKKPAKIVITVPSFDIESMMKTTIRELSITY